MNLFFEPKLVRTTTTLQAEDKKFLKSKGIPIAHAIRDFCNRRRRIDAGELEEEIHEFAEKNKKLQGKVEKLLRVINENFEEEEALEIFRKL